jgi:2-methylcitrate synthase
MSTVTANIPHRQPHAAASFKPKKSVALSGVTAGNTALCTVGKTGNDLHYRGYDILDIAEVCEFEEIAHLLVHGKLPTQAELKAYKAKLKALRGLPGSVKTALEQLPAASHPMDVMRTGVSALGCALPEKDDHNLPGARDIADRLMASLGSMLLTGTTSATRAAASRSKPGTTPSAATFCICCMAQALRELGARHAYLAQSVCRA